MKKPKAYRVLSREYIRKLASLLAGREKIRVHAGNHWSVNIETKELTYDEATLRRYNEDHVIGFLLHEIGHVNYTTSIDTDTELFKKHPTISKNYCNAFEDIRIDYLMSYKYKNSMEAIEAMHEQATAYALETLKAHAQKGDKLKEQLQQFLSDVKNASLSKEVKARAKQASDLTEEMTQMNDAIMVVFGAMAVYYKNMSVTYQKKVEGLIKDKLRPYMTAVLTEMDKAGIEYMEDTIEVQKFWEEKIYPIIKDLIPPEESQDSKNINSAGSSTQGGNGQQNLAKMSEDDAKANAQKNSNGTEDGEKTQSGKCTRAEKAQKGMKDAGDGSEMVAPSVGHEEGGQDGRWYDKAREGAKSYVSNLSARMGRILRDNSFNRYSGKHRSGHIRKKGLYRFHANDTKLFEKKTELSNKSYAVSIVIDSSGSMSGKRWDESLKATSMLVDSLKKLNIPSEVTVFSQSFIVAKEFHQPIVPTLFDEKTSEVFGGGTDLSPALVHAVKSIASRSETDKFVIVLTDGDIDSRDKQVIPELLNKYRDIKFYGIGIQTHEGLRAVIPRSINIKDAGEVPVEFAKILKENIKRK